MGGEECGGRRVSGLDCVSGKARMEKQVGVAEAWGSRGLDRALVEQGIAGPWNPQNARSQDVPTPRLRELNG